ncbi:MAG TPA: hypothetical protein VK960_09875 [Acidimicrobiia bacterium]|nr:hypothetical protein [Acidimicrobiia bacterium]
MRLPGPHSATASGILGPVRSDEEGTLQRSRLAIAVAGLLLGACSAAPAANDAAPVGETSTTVAVPTLRAGTWARSDDPHIVDASYQVINAVVHTSNGFVAGGFDSTGLDADAAVWVSPTGASWERVAAPVFGGPDAQSILGVALGGPGIIAVGFDASGVDTDAAVWASSDGTEWIRIADTAFVAEGDQEIRAVLATDNGFIAAGHDARGSEVDAAVWVSIDGIDWIRIFDPALGGFGHQRISSLVMGPHGIVAGGTNYWPNQFGLFNLDARIWTSPDGRSWEFVDDDVTFGGNGWQYISAVTVGPAGYVAAGTNILGTPGIHNDAAVWVSADGRTWELLTEDVFDLPGVQRISALVEGPEGIVAVGYDSDEDGGRVPAVWISPDGRGWVRVQDPTFEEPGHRWMNAVTTGGPGLIAVGADGTSLVGDPAVWLYALALAAEGG